jgi:hypothetical protein
MATNWCSFSLLQEQAHQFSLVPDAGLVENPGQVTARCPDSDAESIGSGLPAVTLDDLKRERRFGSVSRAAS